jgi:hypothetical protein
MAVTAWISARAGDHTQELGQKWADRATGVGLMIEKKEENRNGPARFGPRSDFQIFNSFLIFQTFL